MSVLFPIPPATPAHLISNSTGSHTPITPFSPLRSTLSPPVVSSDFSELDTMPQLSHVHTLGIFNGSPDSWNIFFSSATGRVAARRPNCDTFNLDTWTDTFIIPSLKASAACVIDGVNYNHRDEIPSHARDEASAASLVAYDAAVLESKRAQSSMFSQLQDSTADNPHASLHVNGIDVLGDKPGIGALNALKNSVFGETKIIPDNMFMDLLHDFQMDPTHTFRQHVALFGQKRAVLATSGGDLGALLVPTALGDKLALAILLLSIRVVAPKLRSEYMQKRLTFTQVCGRLTALSDGAGNSAVQQSAFLGTTVTDIQRTYVLSALSLGHDVTDSVAVAAFAKVFPTAADEVANLGAHSQSPRKPRCSNPKCRKPFNRSHDISSCFFEGGGKADTKEAKAFHKRIADKRSFERRKFRIWCT